MSWNTDGYLQLSNQTRMDRFPKIFERARELKPRAKRILSFGCSTGEEPFTLARYFPDAEIVGTDINTSSLAAARRNNTFGDRVVFTDEIRPTGKYDLVFAMMVLFNMANPIPAEQFAQTLKKIDRHVARRGLLVVYTAEHKPTSVPEIEQNYSVIRQYSRVHNVNKKVYQNGYYRKRLLAPLW